MRVLIIKASALGDIIHALPVLDYLQRVAPGIRIDWVVEGQNRELLDNHPLINDLIIINTKKWRRSLFSPETYREALRVISRLRKASYDLVFDIQGNIKSGVISRLTGADRRYGFDRDGVRESLNLLLNNHHVSMLPDDQHIARRLLRVVSAPFGNDPAGMELQTHIATSIEDDNFAGELVNEHPAGPIVLFHNGTSWATKLWHIDAWVELGTMVIGRHPSASILLSWGSQKERDTAEAISRCIGRAAVVLPHMSLKRFCALLKRVDLVVGGDTGPVHLAAAVSTPTVSFYRVTDPLRNGPLGEKHLNVQSDMKCRECLRKECDRDDECRRSISARAVFELAENLLK
jgi:heptosyltransferase-1